MEAQGNKRLQQQVWLILILLQQQQALDMDIVQFMQRQNYKNKGNISSALTGKKKNYLKLICYKTRLFLLESAVY